MKQAKGVVLHKTKYSENDLIIRMILNTGEKKSFLARGAMKSKRRFAGGVLDPSSFIKIQYDDKGRSLCELRDAEMIESFDGLRTDYDKMEMAFRLLIVADKTSQEGGWSSESQLFNVLGHSLKMLSQGSASPTLELQFKLKVLHQQGVLQTENWMSEFLKLPVSEFEKIKPIPDLSSRLLLVDRMLQEYLTQ